VHETGVKRALGAGLRAASALVLALFTQVPSRRRMCGTSPVRSSKKFAKNSLQNRHKKASVPPLCNVAGLRSLAPLWKGGFGLTVGK
jgi:hypothetical protein